MTSKHISTMVVGSHCLSMNSLGPNLLCLTFAKISSCFIMNNVLSARKCGRPLTNSPQQILDVSDVSVTNLSTRSFLLKMTWILDQSLPVYKASHKLKRCLLQEHYQSCQFTERKVVKEDVMAMCSISLRIYKSLLIQHHQAPGHPLAQSFVHMCAHYHIEPLTVLLHFTITHTLLLTFFSQDLTISFIQHNHFSFPLLTLLYCYHHHDPHWLTQSLDFFLPHLILLTTKGEEIPS